MQIIENTDLKHIAIIMDGNRRWAKNKNLPSFFGHKKGVESLRTITRTCKNSGIKYLTVYAFSTENWNRTKDEVSYLIDLFIQTIKSEVPAFLENDIKVTFIGSRNGLGKNLTDVIEYAENKTKNCTLLNLQIAFNYGARLEITNAVKELCKKVKAGVLNPENITEQVISENLYTNNTPDPDLLIRTGGEKRISNYLLWQCAYTEIYVTDTLWPDFDENGLFLAIEDFNNRQRRYGK